MAVVAGWLARANNPHLTLTLDTSTYSNVYRSRATRPRIFVAAVDRNLVGTIRITFIRARQHPLLPFLDTDRYITAAAGETVQRILASRAQEF